MSVPLIYDVFLLIQDLIEATSITNNEQKQFAKVLVRSKICAEVGALLPWRCQTVAMESDEEV
ncbi:hypothetical protein CHS0354_026316 [Potamilus streckersoni]|uniref:Uncharacterized protein n=1 Tax=Potamilus streckersoni TaxID=2493646 RepID=A0AAE0W9J1_9BIVA|nr:hypothetical protein CHS0354_026316 [Potamilus streckersoni]